MVNKLICIVPEYHPSYIEGSTRGSSQQHFQDVRCHMDAIRFATIPHTINDWKTIPLDNRQSISVETLKANLQQSSEEPYRTYAFKTVWLTFSASCSVSVV